MADSVLIGSTAATAPGRLGRGLYELGSRFDVRRSYLPRLVFVIALYYIAAHIGYAFEFSGPVASLVWLPAGVGIAALYLLGPGLWPAVVIGDLLVNNYSTLPLGSAFGQSFGNLLEVLIAALLLRRYAARNELLGSISGVGAVLLALIAGTCVSATIGLASLLAGGVVTFHSAPAVWRTWWLGDLSGAVIVVPLALAWFPLSRRPWISGSAGELGLVLALLVAVSALSWQTNPPLNYLALPVLTWAALRFESRGATLSMTIGAAVTLWAITHYVGPFAAHSIPRTVLDTQVYLIIASLSAVSTAALVQERERLARSVRASRTRIIAAADDERRRIERNIHDGAQQRLVALAAHLGMAAEDARARPASAVDSFGSAQAELVMAIDELRELVHGIRPSVLRQFGLCRAIELAAARCDVPIEIAEFPRQRLDETAEDTAYYVVLEAITNTQRHAAASNVHVRARLAFGKLELEIDDDGVGGATEQDDLGLQGLRDRVEATGGALTVSSTRGVGTRIFAKIPAVVTS